MLPASSARGVDYYGGFSLFPRSVVDSFFVPHLLPPPLVFDEDQPMAGDSGSVSSSDDENLVSDQDLIQYGFESWVGMPGGKLTLPRRLFSIKEEGSNH